MPQNKLINIISIGFILSHFMVSLLIVIFRIIEWYDLETLQISFSIITPLFVSYTTIIIQHIIENRNKLSLSKKNMSYLFSFLSISSLVVFIIFNLIVIIKQAFSPVSIKEFGTLLGLSEVLFGIYLGNTLKSLFQNKQK